MLKKLQLNMIVAALALAAVFSCVHLEAAADISRETEAAETSMEYEYSVNKDKTVTIDKVTCSGNTLEIPADIEGYPVVRIASGAVDASDLIAVSIPESVKLAEEEAFYNCEGIVELNIHGSTNASKAFKNLNNLKTLNILADHSKEMHDYASSFAVPWRNSFSTILNLSVDDSISHIGDHSFEGLINVTAFLLPSQLESIGEYGCYNMVSVQKWQLPESLRVLKKGALGCDNLLREPEYQEYVLSSKIELIEDKALSRNGKYHAYKNTEAAAFLENSGIVYTEVNFNLVRDQLSLKIGDSFELEFQNTPDFLKEKAEFISENEKVIKVSSDGHLFAYGAGESYVTVKNGTAETKAHVFVNAEYGNTVETRYLRLAVGSSSNVLDLSDFEKLAGTEIVNAEIDGDIISVNDDFSLNALSLGRCNLMLTTSGSEKVRYIVDVYKPVGTILTAMKEFAMVKGSSYRLNYAVYPDDVDDPGVLFSSSDSSIVSVGSNGTLTAHQNGVAEITLKPRDGSDNASIVRVVVTDQSLDLPIKGMPIMLNKNFKLEFSNNHNLYYYSSDPQIAAVSSDGMVSSKALGDVEITVFNKDLTKASTVKIRTYKAFAYGIDVSEWQDTLTYNDWRQIREYGIDFVILRGAYGDYILDKQFENNYDKARQAGLDIGVYHFITATTVQQAVVEANYFLDIIKDKKFEYPVMIDIESSKHKQLSSEEFSKVIDSYGQILIDAGYKVGVYSYASMLTKCSDEILRKYDIWQAHWSTRKPTVFNKPYTMWQYTSDGKVWGINTRCDMNLSFFDYPTYIKNNHYNGY